MLYVSSSSDSAANYMVWSDICVQLENKRPVAGRLHINSFFLSSYFRTTSSFHYQRLLDLLFREFFHLLGANKKVIST